MAIDHAITDELRPLSAHFSAFGLSEPFKVSRNVSMPKPVLATIANWLHHPDQFDDDPMRESHMHAMFSNVTLH